MAKILYSKDFIEEKKDELINRCKGLQKIGLIPKLAVVLVGNNPASLSYVNNKMKFCAVVGAKCEILQLPSNISAADFSKKVHELNMDQNIHGIIIQLPLPVTLQNLKVHEMIIPHKDVDGFNPKTSLDLYYNQPCLLKPCTPSGIMDFLTQHLNINLENITACLIGRSYIVGKPMLLLLNNANATVVWCHSKTKNLKELTKSSDLIITATGKRNYLDSSYFDMNKKQIVIDVGITGGAGIPLSGDLNTDDLQYFKNLSYTPVPGGVGPLTVYKLVDNLISACEANRGIK